MILQIIGIAIAAFTLTEILTEQGMVLNWLHRLITKLPAPLHKPLISCGYCVAGQWAAWLFLYWHWDGYNLDTAITHVGFVTATIFTTHVLLTINYKANV